MAVLVVFFDGATEQQTVSSKQDIRDLVEYYGSSVDSIVSTDGSRTFFKRK
jgi:hypothetical protein